MAIPHNARLKAFVATVVPETAKLFYRDVLGFKLLSEDKYALQFEASGTLLRIAIVNGFTPYPFTVLGWDVDDIEAVIRSLNNKNVIFEKYSFLEQNELGVWNSGEAKVAWFKDPDGNVLSLTQY
ncbi:VOC family protein [Mucilaginibacter sabulilitoris]|uniref:VOC family protein n=1 Tax=Mucilaginibacter sabulilitoris TaxID=1173583 RepID=A0ABZ0TKE4_9SPHI|nr:VOC family protein [Mucilaginibacter sabulilitoris]WPU92658.1 VOC family protein [Mucilaginibacter sabulilitoris]